MKGKNKIRVRGDESDDDAIFGCSYISSASSSYYSSKLGKSSRVGVDTPFIAAPTPRNPTQEKYLSLIEGNPSIIICTGAAGTGKTFWPCAIAIRKLMAGQIDKIIITRPMVGVDEIMGALPGDVISKSEPWVKPITQIFGLYASQQKIQKWIDQDVIEIAPLAMMRGRTFDNAFIIADEFQNSTVGQMKMLLTRIGANSKMIITGDLTQDDLYLPRGQINGLQDIFDRIRRSPNMLNMSEFAVLEFSIDDVQRNPIIKKILNLYLAQP